MNHGQAERLKRARIEAGYAKAIDAARALDVEPGTYNHHENGTAGLSRAGERYARFFGVNLEWLLTGKGEMRPSHSAPAPEVAIDGIVRAGAEIQSNADLPDFGGPTVIKVPSGDGVGAYVVSGDSQWPRFLDGELILYEKRPRAPSELLDNYAIVQTLDGRRVIKIVRANPNGGDDLWRLESHNAPPEDDVKILAAWRYLGVLPRQEATSLPSLKTPKPRLGHARKR
jgi:phage repressor protein C with HTH and peptisase S24 domain